MKMQSKRWNVALSAGHESVPPPLFLHELALVLLYRMSVNSFLCFFLESFYSLLSIWVAGLSVLLVSKMPETSIFKFLSLSIFFFFFLVCKRWFLVFT